MMGETLAQTLIAGITTVGTFTVIVISQITGREPSQGVLTLVTAAMTGVLGYYFGSRGTTSGAAVASDAAVRTVHAVSASLPSAADPAPAPVAAPGPSATP